MILIGEKKFVVKGKTYILGEEKLPVTDKNKVYYFNYNNTKKYDDLVLEKELDNYKFNIGKCYSNTQKLVKISNNLGIPVKFYSGWLKCGKGEPIHHAWGVLGKDKIIDVTLDRHINKFAKKLRPFKEEIHRKLFAEIVVKINKLNTSQRVILGKVPETLTYYGCPDNKENALKTYNNLIDKFPEHYNNKLTDEFGYTDMQRRIIKERG